MTGREPSLTLTELARDPARVHEVGPQETARLLVQLAGLSLALSAHLAGSAQPDTGRATAERLLTAEDCAALAGVSRRQIYAWSRRMDWRPFARRISRKVLRLEERGFRRWLDRQASK